MFLARCEETKVSCYSICWGRGADCGKISHIIREETCQLRISPQSHILHPCHHPVTWAESQAVPALVNFRFCWCVRWKDGRGFLYC